MGAAIRAGLTLGRSAAVLGLGIIGQFALRSLLAAGALPRRRHRRRGHAPQGRPRRRRGPRHRPVGRRRASSSSRPSSNARGAEIVADATGVPDAMPTAMWLACDAGQVIVVGSPRGKAKDVNFYDDLHRRYIEVTGRTATCSSSRPTRAWPAPGASTRRRTGCSRPALRPAEPRGPHHPPHPPGGLGEAYEGLLKKKEEYLGVVMNWGEPGHDRGSRPPGASCRQRLRRGRHELHRRRRHAADVPGPAASAPGGLQPVQANATSTVALVPGSLAGAWGYRRQLEEAGPWVWLLMRAESPRRSGRYAAGHAPRPAHLRRPRALAAADGLAPVPAPADLAPDFPPHARRLPAWPVRVGARRVPVARGGLRRLLRRGHRHPDAVVARADGHRRHPPHQRASRPSSPPPSTASRSSSSSTTARSSGCPRR